MTVPSVPPEPGRRAVAIALGSSVIVLLALTALSLVGVFLPGFWWAFALAAVGDMLAAILILRKR